MRDEIDGRIWDAHGHAFSESLHNGFVAVGTALARLYRLEWEAPWHRRSRSRSGARQA